MICILTEKPSQGRNFAKALGGQKGTFNGENYEIVPALGHLYGYADPVSQVSKDRKEQYEWKAGINVLPWDHTEFAWRRELGKGKSEILKLIKRCADQSTELCIATDNDPTGEGTLIAWEIFEELGLDKSGKKFTRMFFADEAPISIQTAFINRKTYANQYLDPDYNKAIFRNKFDFLTMQFTRIATVCGDGSVLRQGRLKSAMVQLVGDGLKAVKDYKKIPFYQNRFKDEYGNVFTDGKEPMYKTQPKVPQIYVPSGITISSTEDKRSAPPKLLDLADLSARLARAGYKAKDVVATYQKMYENQVVSYPRTEDKYITSEQFNELLPKVSAIAKVVGVDESLLTHKQMRRTHVKEGCAHGANRPGINVPLSLEVVEKIYGVIGAKIYEILAKNYLAMLCEDYEYVSQKGYVTQYPTFIGNATIPGAPGWKMVFADDEDDVEEGSGKGLGVYATPFIHEGFPPKPPTPTMKWLMKGLRKYDVGTGATRTSTYAELTSPRSEKNKYPLMTDKRGKITLTEFGDMSYYLIQGTHIADVKTTEEMYANMRGIADGSVDAEAALLQVADMVVADRAIMKRNIPIMESVLGVKQGARFAFAKKEKVTGSFRGQQVSFNRIWGGYSFTDAEVQFLLDGKEITIQAPGKDGKLYPVTGALEHGMYQGHSYWGFQRKQAVTGGDPDRVTATFKGQQVTFKRTWGRYRFSDMEIEELLKGNVVEIVMEGKFGPYVVSGILAQGTFEGKKYWGFQKIDRKKIA